MKKENFFEALDIMNISHNDDIYEKFEICSNTTKI